MGDLKKLSTFTLVNRASQGEEEAVAALCRRLLPRLTAWAEGRLPPHARSLKDTGDLVQEALMRSVSRIDVFQNESQDSFLRYTQRAVRNLMLNEIRRPHSKAATKGLTEEELDPSPGPLQNLVDRESLARYEAALDKCTPEEQELIVARLELGMSYQEVAIHCGRPSADAARMAVKRAVRKLAEMLNDGQGQESAG